MYALVISGCGVILPLDGAAVVANTYYDATSNPFTFIVGQKMTKEYELNFFDSTIHLMRLNQNC